MGFPVTAWSTLRSIGIGHPVPYHDDVEGVHALAMNVLDGKYASAFMPRERRVLEVDVVAHSFRALDQVLSLQDGKFIPIVEAAYQAASRAVELRFGESIAVGWTACEQLVSDEWKGIVASSESRSQIGGGRKKKLEGRDYTASVKVEILELQGRLTPSLYRNLETARKARNDWAHDMKVPDIGKVQACQEAIRDLLAVKGIQLTLPYGFRPGAGAAWPLEVFKQVHGEIPGLFG
jgi:hypothetical protein